MNMPIVLANLAALSVPTALALWAWSPPRKPPSRRTDFPRPAPPLTPDQHARLDAWIAEYMDPQTQHRAIVRLRDTPVQPVSRD